MNCRQANRLLPLWIGRDLADSSETEALRVHVMGCRDCSTQLHQLQESLNALQSISTTAMSSGSEESRPSLWPRLALVLREMPRRRDQFNGWIPAAAMAMAASLMIAVSVVQVRREIDPSISSGRNLFQTDERFAPGATSNDLQIRGLVGNHVPEF